MGSVLSLLYCVFQRLAIDVHGYTINESEKRMVFRENVDLTEEKWFIQYDMKSGSASLGNWEPGDIDRLSYFKAEHRKRVLDAWYDSQETFWFSRAPVVKYRGNATEKELSAELGFDTSLPEKITIKTCSKATYYIRTECRRRE